MINSITLVGRLTKDPEVKVSQSGITVANFTLAVNRPFTNQQGEREADFIRVSVFRKQAENVGRYLHKGSLAGVVGRLQTRTYDDQQGQRQFISEVVADNVQFLEPKNSQNGESYQNAYNGPPQAQNNQGRQTYQNNQNRPSGGGYGGQGGNQQMQQRQYEPNPWDAPMEINDDDLPF